MCVIESREFEWRRVRPKTQNVVADVVPVVE